VRALKFQQQFAQKFGLNVRIHPELGDEIIYAKIHRADVENYARAKIKNLALRQYILQQFDKRFLSHGF
ncbi:MAG: hypothetical protein NC548_61695, partial [Lachnospiraceae bacterium]|nr:hypothetical protein [Lachnospiraceae bacterium]